jgi:exosortase
MHGRALRFAGLFLLTGLAYAYTWYWLYRRWSAPDSLFAHGFLIPFVFLWLLGRRRERFERLDPVPDYRGLFLILPALCLHLLAMHVEVYSPSGFTLPILLAGIILYFWGWPRLKVLRFPVLYLYFAIPLPMNWVHALSFRLKIFVISLSTGLARFLGADLVDRGSSLEFGRGGSLPVENPCSGLRSLVALLALGVLYAVEFASLSVLGRLVFVLLAIPIAMASNVLRITFLCMVADRYGVQAASGAVHDGSGYAIYIIAFLLMLAFGRLLSAVPVFRRRAPCEANR